jgi:aminoglycoside phosphotransferase family enzyme/predicted kinase
MSGQQRLIDALKNPEVWPGQSRQVTLVETHISYIFLLDDLAYKLKKPVNLGFLDFSTAQKRHHFCLEELRLNRRLAPDVYLDVVPLCGDSANPRPEGTGTPFDWLLKMRRFHSDVVLADQPEQLNAERVGQITDQIAAFHTRAEVAGPAQPQGQPDSVLRAMRENFIPLRHSGQSPQRLADLERWTRQRYAQLDELLQQRRKQGRVRECHGDLHLGNMVMEADGPLIFDGIEFSADLRWIDCLSDLAFFLMDLQHRGRADLAHFALDRYLQHTGDFSGLPLLDFYQCYRALVRAKVCAIRLGQNDLEPLQRQHLQQACLAYLERAEGFTRPGSAALLITHGLSGSGKSHFSRQLPGPLPLVRVRSDVERKRLAGLAPTQRPTGESLSDLYGQAMGQRTFDRLAEAAEAIVRSGRIALVDATFLHASTRTRFHRLADRLRVPFLIIDFEVPRAQLEHRIQQRAAADDDASDADLAVLASQIAHAEPLSAAERQHSWSFAGQQEPLDGLRRTLEQLGIGVTVGRAATAEDHQGL